MNNQFYLLCKRVQYFSPIDEDIYYEWIAAIPAIYKVDGELDEEYLYIDKPSLTDDDLLKILSLFRRYKIDRKQLRVFLNDENKKWLARWVK